MTDAESFEDRRRELLESGSASRLVDAYQEQRQSEQGGDPPLDRLADDLEEMAREADGESAADIWLERGDICEELGDVSEASNSYQNAYSADPTTTEGLRRARSVYIEHDLFDGALNLYDVELRAVDTDRDRARVLLGKAQIEGDYRGDLREAVELAEEALEATPEWTPAEEIRNVYAAGGTIEAEIDDTARLAADARSSGDPGLAAELFAKAARLQVLHVGSGDDRARELLEEARSLRPEHPEVQAVEERYFGPGEGDEHAVAEHDAAGEASQTAVVGDRDGDGEAATEGPETAAGADEESEPTDRSDEGRQEEVEPPDEAGEPEEAESGEASEAVETSVANGEAPVQQEHDSFDREGYWSQREASDLGLDGARQRLDAEPGDVSALAVARRELREQGGDEELVERLEAALDARRGTDAEPVLLAELGELHWRQLEDWERAEYYFRRLKVHDNRHPDVLAFYEAFLEREENWRRLFSLLKVREEEADGLDERRHLAERRAEIAEEQLGSSQRAIDVWKDYLRRVDGEDDQARRRLRELFEEHELWNGLVDFLKDEIERFEREEPGAVDERIERLERLAEVYEEIGNRVMAINALQEILDLQPLHDEAFEQLRELLRGSSRWRDLATLLADRADALLEVDREAEAADLLERTAELYAEQFQNPSRAAPYLEQLLEIAPDRAEAREQLAGVYRRRRDWEALYELKREALDRAGGDADRELLDEIRRLAHDRLGEPERAAPALEALVDRGEAGPEVLRELEEVYRSRGDWERLADVLRRRADETDETSRRVDLLSKLARVLGDPLDEPQRAADVWREVLEARPEHGEAFAELTDLYLEEQRFDELEELYAERGRFSRLFDLFDSAARVRSDAAVQRDLYRRMARLAEEELGDPNRHIISLESLADVAEGEDVADELADAYQQAGDVERELEARRAQLEACEEAERRAELLDRIAALESTVDESQKAFERLIRLVQLEPGRHDALERAEHLARTVGELQTFVDEVLAIADACDDEEIRLQLLTRAAPILADELGESERALDRYEEIRDRRPEDPAVLGTLAELYAADGDAEGRVEVLRERVEVRRERDDGPSETADDLLELADALAHDLERWEEAADVYERVLTDLPGNADALHGLQDLHREREAWEDLADALQRELAVVDGADADDRSDEWRSAEAVRRELADLQRGRLDRPTDALHNYRDILDHEPQAEQAVEGLEALLENPDCAREASLLLGELFRDRGAFGRLAEVLEERIERSEDPFERAETAGELAELYRNELDDADRAFQWASRQFDWNPDDEENWDRLEALADRTGRWSDVVEQFAGATALESPEISEDRLSLLRRIAELQLQKLDDVSGAIDALEVHRERAPEDRAVADQLENLYRRAGRTESLVDLLVDRAESLDEGDQRIQRLEEAAALCEDQLDDLERAVELRYRVVQDRPADSAAVGAYERLLRETERWEALEALVEEQLDAAESDEEERDRRLELAELRGLRTGDYEGAFELLAPMVESEPVDDRAVEALEELDVALIKAASSRVDLRIEIAEVLEPIYRRRGDRDQLVYALGIQLRGIDDPERRVDLLEERADLYAEELDQPTSAFDDLAAALRIEPADADRRRRVEELAERVDRREDLIDVYAEAREGADEEVADALDRRIGRMAADLGDRSRAVEAWSRVRQRNGKDAEALEALEELYDELDRIGELAEILWKRVELADESERRPLLARLGEIERSELGRPDRAMIAYERLLDLESEAEAALDALEGLYEEHGRWFDLADALERKVEVADEDETRVGALSRLGQLCEGDELDDRPRAIEAYSRAVDIDPDCTDALRALDRLYEQTGQPDERAEVLRRRLRTAEAMDMEARREIELELADLFRADLGRPEDALELYRVVLERDTGHDRAVEGLAELVDRPDVPESAVDLLAEQYEAVEDWESLADLHRRRRDRASDREERARASYDLGRLLADSIGDEQGAVDALADAWIFAPDEETYREAAVEALEAHGDWQRAVDVRRDVLDELDDPDERVEMHLELGDLLRNRLERTVDAEEEYRRAIDIDESRPAAYDRLESILEEGERWLDLIDLVERRIEVFEDDEQERVEQIERIAEIYEGALDDPFQAADAWERLLEIRPDHRRALEQLGDLYRRQEKWQALADHLEHRLEQTEHPDEIVDLVYELAEITREHLYRPDHAVDLYEQLLEIVPGHEPTVESLEALVESDAGVRERAAELLARAYREHGRWADLVDALYEWAEAAESGEQARDRLSEAFEVARDRLEDPEAAHDVVERMLHVEPRNADVRADVRAFAEEHAAWSFLDELYESVLAEKLPPGEPGRAEVLAERAAWVEQRLEELDRAGDLFRDALAEDPSLDAAIEGLERALVRSEKWDELAEFLGERARGTDDPDRRRARLRRAGRIYERIRVDLDAAAEAYGEALDRTGPDRAILDALERIERRRGEWEELVSRLRRAVDEADDPDDRAEVRHRLGVILHRRLDSPEEAARLYADNLTDAPDSVRPVRALEELETDLADRDKDWTVLRRRIVEDLASRVDADADWERAADLAERAAALGGDPDRRSRYLLEAVEAIDAGAEQEIARLGAVERAARARAVDPGDSRAGEVLEEVVDGVGHWEVVARELSKVLEETSDPDRRAELALMAGRVYEDELDDPERAAESYRVAADSDGAEALERLERMLELLGRDEERAEVLEERIDREVEPDRRFELLERAAELYDDVLSAPERAADCYRRIVEEQPDAEDAYASLQSLYERIGDHEALAEVLERRIQAVEDESERRQLQVRLAELREDELGDLDAAVETYRSAMTGEEPEPEILDSLVRLYRQTERWDQLLRALETKREQVEDPAERSALEVERAELQLERLDDAEGALETYRAVLERDPDCDEALQGLRSLVERTDVGDRATDLLAERLRENEQWIQLRELLESRIESVDDPHRLAERYRELARVLEERLDNPDMAFIALGRGLNHTPGEEELRADLRRLGEELDNGEDLYALYEDAIDGGVEDESTRLALHREAADIAEEQLEDVDAAIDHARTTLELDEEHLPTLEQLDRLYQRQHAWGDLADILQRQLDLAGGDEAPELEYRLGYLFEQYLGDRRRALESYRRALEDEPGQVGVVEGLERLIDDEELRGEVADLLEPVYRRDERYADLVDLLDRRREVVEGDGRRAELLLESAQIRIERLDEFELGWANLSRALRAEPGADDVLERLEATADEYGRHEELVALLEEVAEESSDPVTSARLLRRAGRRAREELDDAEWAARLFRRAHDSEPDDREALEGFESVARELDDPSSLVEALRRRAETSYEPDDRRQAFLEIGEIEADRGRTEEAIDAYREALELDETDRRAMRSLVDLYEETDRHAELVRTLERLERTVDDPDELTEIHEEIARYSRYVLEDLDRAIEATRSILRFEPDHRAALEELEDLYRETEQWENLRDVLVREFEIAEADDRPSDARRAARQLAELSRDRFEDVGDAIHWFERAAEFAEAGEEIESSLAELYGRAERWGALAELYESRYERADVDDERLEAALQLSRLCLSRLGDFARAEEYLERAENIAGPETEVLDLKADLHRELGRWDELAGLLDRRASAAESAERELELRLERGELLRSRLDSAAAAVEEFERALEVDPDDERAMAALDDLYRQLGRSADRFDILAHHVQHADDPDVRADLAVDMADLARVGQGDRLTAIEALESALDRAPADPQVARPLVRLLEEQGEFDRASEVVEQLLEEGDLPDDERVRLLHARGQLAEQDDRPEDALEQYRAGVEVDDAHLPNLMSLGKLEYRLEEYEQARERFQQLLLHQMKLDSDEKKVQVYYHLGLVESELGNDRRARDMFDRALGVDPDHEPSKRAKEALG